MNAKKEYLLKLRKKKNLDTSATIVSFEGSEYRIYKRRRQIVNN